MNVFTEIGDAGNITINSSEGNIDTTAGTLRARSNLENGGSIDLTAAGNINTGTITTVSENQNGGNITLNSTGGEINTSQGVLRASSESGNGGTIRLTATGNITTADVNVFYRNRRCREYNY